MILVTGGAGYIGSHTCIELIQSGFDVLVLDNLSNSSPESLKRVEQITGKPITFIRGDVRDKALMKQLFDDHAISSVIHFAGLKAVGESVSMPLEYYDNNIGGTLALLEAMADSNCRSLVFSSSATVYGDPHTVPIREDFPLSATNPYGRSKLIIEEILKDLYLSDNAWNLALLRYFNPVGAHESGLIGEDPNGPPNNLMPVISQVAIGRQKSLNVFGGDYPTPDGTGVRDYIHVVDLARGHVTAVQKLQESPGLLTINLGTGQGYSVLEMVKAFEAASGREVPYQIVERRPGDVATCYADPSYAREVLDWESERNLQQMCEDTWRWQSMNPNGYAT
jgi:UDP-glucose 4-epimerase